MFQYFVGCCSSIFEDGDHVGCIENIRHRSIDTGVNKMGPIIGINFLSLQHVPNNIFQLSKLRDVFEELLPSYPTTYRANNVA